MTSINGAVPNVRVTAQKAAEPEAPVTGGNEATDQGILISNPSFGRNFLRWGGVAAAVGGVAALAVKAGTGGGIAAVRGTPFLPLAIGGAALGALGLGLSFLGGLQPKYKPLVEQGIGDLDVFGSGAATDGFFPGRGSSWSNDGDPEFVLTINSGLGDVEVSRG
jgi:hypothetical protein